MISFGKEQNVIIQVIKKESIIPLMTPFVGLCQTILQDSLKQPVTKFKALNVMIEEISLKRSWRMHCQEISNDYMIYSQEQKFDVINDSYHINFLEAILSFNYT